MSAEIELLLRLEALAAGGPHPVAAYLWVLRVIDDTRRRLEKEGHIDAAELLEGHRELGLREFGPMAYEVFQHWGLASSREVGRVVFDMVEGGVLRKTEEDRLEDFDQGYDFHDAFVVGYRW